MTDRPPARLLPPSELALTHRHAELGSVEAGVFDVVVVGGGITGACLFHHLAERGYRTLLVDQRDFGGGSSQASAMMVWGGLLYLRSLDLVNVWQLSRARGWLMREAPSWVHRATFAYLPRRTAFRPVPLLWLLLRLYTALGGLPRARPHFQRDLSEWGFLKTGDFTGALVFEEARLFPSDARFVLAWILAGRSPDHVALNYCSLASGQFDSTGRAWHLEVKDLILQKDVVVRSRLVVNTAGVWTDLINHRTGIETPYAHLLSKGVFIGLPRDPRHRTPLVFECGANGQIDAMPLLPWGPIALWGPTETPVADLDGSFVAEAKDVRSLLDQLNQHLALPVSAGDIVSLRCGVRALAVDRRASRATNPLSLSRRFRVFRNADLRWIAVYGGKLTDSVSVARSVVAVIADLLGARRGRVALSLVARPPTQPDVFSGLLDPVPSPAWCVTHEMCWTLDDYLRRRTNIAQWVPRGGLGQRNENVTRLEQIAATFCAGDRLRAGETLRAYRETVEREVDHVLTEAEEMGRRAGCGRVLR